MDARSMESRVPTHHVVDDSEAGSTGRTLPFGSHVTEGGDISVFYPGQTRGQAEIQSKMVDFVNRIAVQANENVKLRAELEAAKKVIQESKGGDRPCSTCSGANVTNGLVNQTPTIPTPTSEVSRDSDSPLSPEKELELLRAQVRDIARVCRAVAKGDLENKITLHVEGPIMSELKEVINGMVDQLKSFAGEVERVATEGESEQRRSLFQRVSAAD